MYREDDFSRLELDLKGCQYNYRYFRGLLEPSTKLLVLVKANAYGHGAVEFAAMMQQAGANYLAVAYPVEGMELRQAGISLPILVLTAGTDFFPEIIENRLEPGIPNLFSLKAFCKELEARGMRDYPVHIKLDTGMHRLGFMTDELPALMDFLKDCPYVRVQSIYSHLAVAEDPQEDAFTLGQIRMFKENADSLTASLGYKPMYHILNSAGIERFPQYQFDMVRLGIGIYGISALPDVKLRAVASLKCKVLQVKTLHPEDGTIGYGRYGHIAPEGTTIATIPVGYADGIDRHLGKAALRHLRKRRRPWPQPDAARDSPLKPHGAACERVSRGRDAELAHPLRRAQDYANAKRLGERLLGHHVGEVGARLGPAERHGVVEILNLHPHGQRDCLSREAAGDCLELGGVEVGLAERSRVVPHGEVCRRVRDARPAGSHEPLEGGVKEPKLLEVPAERRLDRRGHIFERP